MGQILGFIYAFFLFLSIFGKTSRKILIMQTFSFFFKGLHYLLLGGLSGFLTSFVSMIRNLIFYKLKSNRYWTILFVIIFLLIGIFTYDTFFSLMPVIATIIYTLIINYNNPTYLRYGMLLTSLTWLIYNIYVVSYSGIMIQIILLISNVIAIIKLDKKK